MWGVRSACCLEPGVELKKCWPLGKAQHSLTMISSPGSCRIPDRIPEGFNMNSPEWNSGYWNGNITTTPTISPYGINIGVEWLRTPSSASFPTRVHHSTRSGLRCAGCRVPPVPPGAIHIAALQAASSSVLIILIFVGNAFPARRDPAGNPNGIECE